MPTFLERLQEEHELAVARREVQQAEAIAAKLKFIERIPRNIAGKLLIPENEITIVDYSSDRAYTSSYFIVQIDGVLLKFGQKYYSEVQSLYLSEYDVFFYYFDVESQQWKEEKLLAYSNLSLVALADALYDKYSVESVVSLIEQTKAVWKLRGPGSILEDFVRTALRVKLSLLLGTSAIALRELNDNKGKYGRYVFQTGLRVICVYYDRDYTNSERMLFSVWGYTRMAEQFVPCSVELSRYSPEQDFESIDSRIFKVRPDVVFAAKEVMEVLGLEPYSAEESQSSEIVTAS